MQEKRDTSPVRQLELDLIATAVIHTEAQSRASNNVVHVQFGVAKPERPSSISDDQGFVDLLLQNAQRLKW